MHIGKKQAYLNSTHVQSLILSFDSRSGKCKNTILGNKCETGLRKKTYNVLTGSVLSVWTQVEDVLTREGNAKGTSGRMQVHKTTSIPLFYSVSLR